MRLIPLADRKLYELAGIHGDHPFRHTVKQSLIENVLQKPQASGSQTAFPIQSTILCFLVDIVLEIEFGDLAEQGSLLFPIREDMVLHQSLIALFGHLVDGMLKVSGFVGIPQLDCVHKGNVGPIRLLLGTQRLRLFMILQGFSQQLLCLGLVALYRKLRVDPLLLPFAVFIGVQNDIVDIIFGLQAACHGYHFSFR